MSNEEDRKRYETWKTLTEGPTTDRVRAALLAGGYTENESILVARYETTNSRNQEVHRIFFINDEDGEIDSGLVYIEEKNGRLVGDF